MAPRKSVEARWPQTVKSTPSTPDFLDRIDVGFNHAIRRGEQRMKVIVGVVGGSKQVCLARTARHRNSRDGHACSFSVTSCTLFLAPQFAPASTIAAGPSFIEPTHGCEPTAGPFSCCSAHPLPLPNCAFEIRLRCSELDTRALGATSRPLRGSGVRGAIWVVQMQRKWL